MHDDAADPGPYARFDLQPRPGEQGPVLVVTGEIDLANAADFTAAMQAASGSAGPLTVDLSGLSYMDSAAVRAMFHQAANGELRLETPRDSPAWQLVSISGLDKLPSVELVALPDGI